MIAVSRTSDSKNVESILYFLGRIHILLFTNAFHTGCSQLKNAITTLAASAVAIALMLGTKAQAEELSRAGTPITAENIVDVLDIQRVLDAQVDAFDNQDWELARSLMTEEFFTTMRSQNGPHTLSSDAFLEGAADYYDGVDHFLTHHTNSGYRVFFHDKDSATIFARGVIIVNRTPAGEHAADGGSVRMERWNSYEYGVERTDEGWKINKILITYNSDDIRSDPKVQ
ncbi:nuclear transport factor 2 family protein [Roseibium sp. MMSF_3544]|uniref:nuclear transport factor 2 family protein n=1 Tax=Roseibium sp. MMSF_3544 TaxID=3046723 RepID=UPI00273D7FC3|nr:nuclear transport factor 2 family protein [Roseibium sp. MMSF_3544]